MADLAFGRDHRCAKGVAIRAASRCEEAAELLGIAIISPAGQRAVALGSQAEAVDIRTPFADRGKMFRLETLS